MKTIGITDLDVCFPPAGGTRAEVTTKFERQSGIWDQLTGVAGYPGAYRNLFATLRGAGMLPGGPHRVLDAGAGTAALSRAYAQAVGGRAAFTALDLSARMLERARRSWNPALGPINILARNIGSTGLRRGRFDVVMSAHCIEHTADPAGAIGEMARVLRAGGLLLLVIGRPGPLDAITSRIWRYQRIDACDVLRWMWECDVAPLGRLRFGSAHQLGHWLSEAVLGRKGAHG